jgi:3-deoxy-D-manno-octulosonate 8-phosphate phosphatase (KDO 8-P phosphatase)
MNLNLLPEDELRKRLAGARILLCDVDGVLTDATVTIGPEEEYKKFDIRDGLGMVALRRQGIPVGWISSRPSAVTAKRAAELKIDYCVQQKTSKVAEAERILNITGLKWSNLCYIGDDIVDLGVMRRAGLAIAVPDAVPEMKAAAHYITAAPGGRGAVREVAELLLKAQGKWQAVLDSYET